MFLLTFNNRLSALSLPGTYLIREGTLILLGTPPPNCALFNNYIYLTFILVFALLKLMNWLFTFGSVTYNFFYRFYNNEVLNIDYTQAAINLKCPERLNSFSHLQPQLCGLSWVSKIGKIGHQSYSIFYISDIWLGISNHPIPCSLERYVAITFYCKGWYTYICRAVCPGRSYGLLQR